MRLANESLPPGSPFYRNRTTGLTAALILAVNKAKCCYRDASLARAGQSTYVQHADG